MPLTHVKSFRASGALWGALQYAGSFTRNEFIAQAIGAWLAIPDSQTDATPEHDRGIRDNHTVRLPVDQKAALEAKAERLGATDSDCINAAILQALPELPETPSHAQRAWKKPKDRPEMHPAALRNEAVKMVVEQSRTVPSVAGELGVKEGTIYRWVSLYRSKHPSAEPAPVPAAEIAAAAPPTPKPAATRKKPPVVRTEPPAPVPAPAPKAPKVAAVVQAARAAGHNVTTASQMGTTPAIPVFKAGPLVDCLHENFRGVKGVCPDCLQWVGGKRLPCVVLAPCVS